jgi:outer membrane protein insertion porin family
LGYFEQLKPDDPNVTDRQLDEKAGTVDLTLKVHEKGKNSIGLNGGVSGLSGAFIGLSYSTNNFLGLGETLTVQANIGNLQRNLVFGFTQPYLFDRPLQAGFTVFTQKYNYNQARQSAIISGQQVNLPQAELQNLQNYTQSSTGFTLSLSYPLRRSLKRVGVTYSFDRSSLVAVSDASKNLFTFLAFQGLSGPNSLNGIVTSKIFPTFTYNRLDSSISPKSGSSLTAGIEVAGLGGTVKSVRPIIQYKHFIPVQKHRNTIGFNVQGSFLSGYDGVVAPPFQRFYMGGENDLRGFDTRSVSPVAYLPNKAAIVLRNGDGSVVLKDPSNPLRGAWTVPIPSEQIVFPGGDTSFFGNLEYRITIAGPVAVAPFVDAGYDAILRNSQLKITPEQTQILNTTRFGCPKLNVALDCDPNFQQVPGSSPSLPLFSGELHAVSNTNWVPRMSTGLELQVFLPIVNAPFRIYWAYNPLRLDTISSPGVRVSRNMFPEPSCLPAFPCSAGDYTFRNAVNTFSPSFQLREPRKTFRFSVATTF